MSKTLTIAAIVVGGILALARIVLAQTHAYEPSPYVYKIQAGECPGESPRRVLTGFRVKDLTGIVTALHGVAGCKSITSLAADGTAYVDLAIGRVDIERDVALLWSVQLAAAPADGLPALGARPKDADYADARVLGFPYDVVRQREIGVYKILETTELGNLLPSVVVRVVSERSSPAPAVKVLSVQGPLVMGHSGGPLLNGKGYLLGVANGGIDMGRTDMAWAIPWQDVTWSTVLTDLPPLSWSGLSDLYALEELDPVLVFPRDFQEPTPTTATVPSAPGPTPTATPTATFTPTHTPTLQLSPTPTETSIPTPAPTRIPSATPTIAATPTPTLSPIPPGEVVSLIEPLTDVLKGKLIFSWKSSIQLEDNQYYEMVFWEDGKEPMENPFSPVGARKETTVSVNLDGIDLPQLKPGHNYKWGILLVELNPYEPLRHLGGNHRFRFERTDGSSGGGSSPTSTPRPPPPD